MRGGESAGYVLLICIMCLQAAVLPPPWADPVRNPCVIQPGGWQLLFWPLDGQCYRIFQQGPPCPDTMELGPGVKGAAECRCPPGTAQSPRDALCHTLFKRGPCPRGQYFAPVPDKPAKSSISNDNVRSRWGTCREPDQCLEEDHIFWARDERCYPQHKRGPCPKGELLTASGSGGIGECRCKSTGVLGQYYWASGDSCYEHFTRGPCMEKGTLFLPNGQCGCNEDLPHYNSDTEKCYEIGGIGPCPPGHQFILSNENLNKNASKAACKCKEGHALWAQNGACYRLYTRGPCSAGQFLVNSTSCVQIPCRQGRLYFPEESTCYKIGTRGPCPTGQIVLFENAVRPSVDGVSYRGMCGCSGPINNPIQNQCHITHEEKEKLSEKQCDSKSGMVKWNDHCYPLYSKGPCSTGQWLVPVREAKQWFEQVGHKKQLKATCECRPGYKPVKTIVRGDIKTGSAIYIEQCQSPSVSIARFLNLNFNSQH